MASVRTSQAVRLAFTKPNPAHVKAVQAARLVLTKLSEPIQVSQAARLTLLRRHGRRVLAQIDTEYME